MDALYLEVCVDFQSGHKCSLETLLTLCVFDYCSVRDVSVIFVQSDLKGDRIPMNYATKQMDNKELTITENHDLPWQVRSCKLPVISFGKNTIAGLCGVIRQLTTFRTSLPNKNEHPDGLLGFRGSCLQAPNEVSVWTKFCEIEIIETVYLLLKPESRGIEILPEAVAKFENHLTQPIRVHNISKVTRDFQSVQSDNCCGTGTEIKSNVERRNEKELSLTNANSSHTVDSTKVKVLEHSYAEGPFLTLGDILLYPCYIIIFHILNLKNIQSLLPNTVAWFEKFEKSSDFKTIRTNLSKIIENVHSESNCSKGYVVPSLESVSLYKCDPKRKNPKKREFTKCDQVKTALKYFDDDPGLKMDVEPNKYMEGSHIRWCDIPPEANPYGDYLPDKRKERKTQQLENFVKCVESVAKDGQTIVDFCCGSGHLGILLAHFLPKCTIVLVENKEESLNRAKLRVTKMRLGNVYFFQCNIDYFVGSFDIGVAIHACGVATDLVLEKCILKKASFVVCPCCYGSLHCTERLQYPRSNKFSAIPVDKYLSICHAADQTHDNHPLKEQGTLCMTIIDSDRLHHAHERGYNTFLSQIEPVTCTPKNMLLVGSHERV